MLKIFAQTCVCTSATFRSSGTFRSSANMLLRKKKMQCIYWIKTKYKTFVKLLVLTKKMQCPFIFIKMIDNLSAKLSLPCLPGERGRG